MLFASDLDNTLIHSYKKAIKGDVCVEWKDGKELSFMAYESYHLLKKIVKKCEFIPVTTRSLEQYRRIDLGVIPKYAIVANGAMLLVDGKVDEEWIMETRELISIELPVIKENSIVSDIRYVDDFFIFLKSEKPKEAVAYLESVICNEKFAITDINSKVYIIPRNLNKSGAVNRLRKKLDKNYIICSGDSALDISMLEIADIAFHPETLIMQNRNQNRIMLSEKSFTLDMLKNVIKIIEHQKLEASSL